MPALLCSIPLPSLPLPFRRNQVNDADANNDEEEDNMHLWHRHADKLEKPVEENPTPEALPHVSEEEVENGLVALVDHSETQKDVSHGIHMHSENVFEIPWIHRLIPGIEKLASAYHFGNFVVDRDTGIKLFESMPIYARIGMHLLFYGSGRERLLNSKRIDSLLKEQSIKQGKIYDSPESVASIPSFVKTYKLHLDELLYPDLSAYKTFNEFFYRKLKPDARPVQNAQDPLAFCSAADCRLTVYQSVDLAKKFWVKGDQFDIPRLLNISHDSLVAQEFDNSGVAIFRLAPADYHRFHCPLDCVVGDITNVPGSYYTVNPQAVNEVDFDVFTANIRSILYLTHEPTGKRVAFIAIGALLVGSIIWTGGATPGTRVKRGEELGYFAYGGSTVIALFPKGLMDFDADLVRNSEVPIETLVKVGYSLGKVPGSR